MAPGCLVSLSLNQDERRLRELQRRECCLWMGAIAISPSGCSRKAALEKASGLISYRDRNLHFSENRVLGAGE